MRKLKRAKQVGPSTDTDNLRYHLPYLPLPHHHRVLVVRPTSRGPKVPTSYELRTEYRLPVVYSVLVLQD